MKLVCTQENLYKGLNTVSHITQKNVSLPILNNVLLRAEEGIIKLITTNLEIGITYQIRGKVEENGNFTVDAKTLTEYISFLPKDKVELVKEGQQLKITTQNSQTKMNGLSEEDFPLIPSVEKKEKIVISSKELKQSIQKVAISASSDSSRMEIGGVLLKIEEKNIFLVATDSYRLSEKNLAYKEKQAGPKEIIVPLRTFQEVARILSDEDEEVEISLSDNQILFSTTQVELVSRLIEGRYPDYKQIIPQTRKTRILGNREELIKTIKSASIFCQPPINDIHLGFFPEKKEVVATTVNNQIGETITRINADIEGEETQIVFNYKYLLDGLNSIETEDVVIEIINESNPGVLKNKDRNDFLYLIMPIKQ